MSAEPQRPAPAAPGNEPGLSKGATIGRYIVLGLLGRGGMGDVYAAYDPELDRKIAVKLLRARGRANESADGKTRLLREAQAIARLSHPNVVVVYDVGTYAESVFIAMEFVEGNTLGYWLEAQTRGWREVLEVFAAAGKGLIAAHAAGLVHRDFKPDNVMLTKSGQVRVMDFGLARQQVQDDEPSLVGQQTMDAEARAAALAETLDPEADPDATAQLGDASGGGAVPAGSGGYLRVKLTRTGAVLGTPAYMAPEQFAGTGGDARTDQFSFCVALYEGLYGKRPFAGDNVLALMTNVVAGTIIEPPADSKVPGWIRRVVLRGLATAPADRWPTMTDLLAALAKDPAARRRRWLAAATGMLGVAALGLGVQRFSAGQHALCAGGPTRAATAWGPEQRKNIERAFTAKAGSRARTTFASTASLLDRYISRWTGMYKEACEANHIRGEQSAEVLDLRMGCLNERLSSVRALTDLLAAGDPGVVENAVSAAGGLPTLDRCSDVTMLRAVIKLPEDPAKRAQVASLREEVAKVNVLAKAGQCDRAAKAGTPSLEAARGTGFRPLVAEAALELGRLGDTCIDPPKALEHLEEAVMSAEASHHDEVTILASTYFATLYADRIGDHRAARYWVRHAEAILSRFPGHPILEAWLAGARSLSLAADGRHEEGLLEERRALALKQAALGRDNVDVAISLMNVGNRLHELGLDAEATDFTAQAIEIFSRLLGNDSSWVAISHANQSEQLTGVKRFDAAHAAIDRALSIWKAINASPFFIGYGHLTRGRLWLAEEKAQAARPDLERAIDLLQKTDAGVAAEAKFALAKACWPTPRDRPRALTLAREARMTLAGNPSAARRAAEVESWLRARTSI
jgi:serine/threonine protein kinase/tetratricopeptide (TPR) repeat protein